jgi:hypothetical protein
MSFPTTSLPNTSAPFTFSTLAEMRANGQAPLRTNVVEQNSSSCIDLNAAFRNVQNFFRSLIEPNSYFDKVINLANKSWRFINTNWDIIALGVSLVALGCLINPMIKASIVIITKQFFVGFTAGFTLTHFFSEQTNSYFDRIRSMDPILQAVSATIASAIFAPIAPFIGGLIIGNHTYKHLN